MKKITITILSAIAVFTGCNVQVLETSEDGQLSLELSASGDYVTISSTDALAEQAARVMTKSSDNADVNEFKIEIVRASDGFTTSFSRFGDMPQVLNLPSGNYTLTASSPVSLPAAFDQPVYGIRHSFPINVGKATSEKLVCTLQNMKVTFALSDAFKSELSSYTITVSNGESVQNMLCWTNVSSETEDQYTTKDINKAGYFSVAPLTISVSGKRATDGSSAYHEIKLLDGKAKDHFIVKLDAKVTGTAGFQITVDPGVNPRPEDVYVPGFNEDPVPDDPDDEGGNTGSGEGDTTDPGNNDNTGGGGNDSADDMQLIWPGNESLSQTEIVDGMTVELTVLVPGEIKEFTIDVTSDTQEFLSLVSMMTSNQMSAGSIESVHLDLINDPVAVQSMSSVGLKTGGDLSGHDEVSFSLSQLVPMIPTAGQAGPDSYHTFKLNVTDNDGDTKSWSLVFHVPAE